MRHLPTEDLEAVRRAVEALARLRDTQLSESTISATQTFRRLLEGYLPPEPVTRRPMPDYLQPVLTNPKGE
jgi:hypothetical protein